MILKIFMAIVAILLILFIGMLVKLAADSRRMTVDLGLQNGQLSPCPESPNCVSSDAPATDSHYIAPLANADDPMWSRLLASLETMAGVVQVARDDAYARYTYNTPVLGFVDDVEFLYRPEQGEIAMRSASRVGYGDMNTNRKRLEAIRTLLQTP